MMVKAREYIKEKELDGWEEKVSAPFHVVDILRCTFTVTSAKRNLEISETLLQLRDPASAPRPCFTLIRSKNGHHPRAEKSNMGGYADRKLNLAMTLPTTSLGAPVTIVTEVQILLTEYSKVKKRMHACYRAARGDFGKVMV